MAVTATTAGAELFLLIDYINCTYKKEHFGARTLNIAGWKPSQHTRLHI